MVKLDKTSYITYSQFDAREVYFIYLIVFSLCLLVHQCILCM